MCAKLFINNNLWSNQMFKILLLIENSYLNQYALKVLKNS